jgi:GUN4-like/CHAT domain
MSISFCPSCGKPVKPPLSAGRQFCSKCGWKSEITQARDSGFAALEKLERSAQTPIGESSPIRILFLVSDPSDVSRLRLGQELRDIKEKLQLSMQRDTILLESRESVRPSDLTQAIFDFNPQIVHFSGHGTQDGDICLENIEGQLQPISPSALTDLFSLVSDKVRCVILNACYSEIQARAIAEHIPYVIGMNKAIGDKAAITFSVGFYKAIAARYSVENAYKFGCVEIQLNGIKEHLTPVFYALRTQDTSPEMYVEHPSVEPMSYPASVPQPQNAIDTVLLKSENGVDYRNLRDLLKAEKWREADEETLKVMLKAANRENQGWLDNANLTAFPCEDLQTIDRLWVTASNGHFGFSVQKRIWEECGSPMEYNRNWIMFGFGTRVGWYIIMGDESPNWKNLINYPNLKFSTSISPVGELPRCFVTFDKWSCQWKNIGVLFSRANGCGVQHIPILRGV